jgi:hypothetical protein
MKPRDSVSIYGRDALRILLRMIDFQLPMAMHSHVSHNTLALTLLTTTRYHLLPPTATHYHPLLLTAILHHTLPLTNTHSTQYHSLPPTAILHHTLPLTTTHSTQYHSLPRTTAHHHPLYPLCIVPGAVLLGSTVANGDVGF